MQAAIDNEAEAESVFERRVVVEFSVPEIEFSFSLAAETDRAEDYNSRFGGGVPRADEGRRVAQENEAEGLL